MGNVTLPVGATDKRVTRYVAAYLAEQRRPADHARAQLAAKRKQQEKLRADIAALRDEIRDAEANALTQARLARALGTNEAGISRRLSGQLPWAGSITLDDLATALDVPVSELIGEK